MRSICKLVGKAVLTAALLILGSAASAQPIENLRNAGGPTSMIMTYKANPAKKVALREYMLKTGLQHLNQWKSAKIISEYHVLMTRYVDADHWDMMVILDFANYADLSKWNAIEKTNPAGLEELSLAYCNSINTSLSDRVRRKDSAKTTANPVYFIIPYRITVGLKEYLAYLGNYVAPQFDGWVDEGLVNKYDMYIARHATARWWSSMIILEYADDAALGQRDAAMTRVRAKLAQNPEWKAIADNKKEVRVGRQYIIAEELKAK